MADNINRATLNILVSALDNADGITVFETKGDAILALMKGQVFRLKVSLTDVGKLDIERYEGLGVTCSITSSGSSRDSWDALQDAYLDGLHRNLKRSIGAGNIEFLPDRFKNYALSNIAKLNL
ncbi:TPA: hypothetical protein ACSCYS_003491 [Aeromonas veronii]